jgi:hypothetical protein
MITSGISTSISAIVHTASAVYHYRTWTERSNALTPDRRAMVAAAAALQQAALVAAFETTARLAEFTLREAGAAATTLLETLGAPPGTERRAWERTPLRLFEQEAEAFRVFAGAPRLWLMLFVGELDRIRGPRFVEPSARNAANAFPGAWSADG